MGWTPPPLFSKTFCLLEKVMYWLTYHRPLGTSAGKKQTGVDLPSPSCHIKFRECPEGSGPASVMLHPGDKDEEPSFFYDLLGEADSSHHEEAFKHLYLTLFLLDAQEEFLSSMCPVRVN